MKSHSGLLIATFEPSQELNEIFKVKYIPHEKITFDRVKSINNMQYFSYQNFNCSVLQVYTGASSVQKAILVQDHRYKHPIAATVVKQNFPPFITGVRHTI